MAMYSHAKPVSGSLWISLALLIVTAFVIPAASAQAAPKKCFGKKVDRVITKDGGKARLGFKEVAYVSGNNVTVIGKPNSVICGGEGRQIIKAGKGKSLSDGGPGNDKIFMHDKSLNSQAIGGPGQRRDLRLKEPRQALRR